MSSSWGRQQSTSSTMHSLSVFRVKFVQPQQQFVWVGGVHVVPRIGEAYPHAIHIFSAGQPDPDGIVPDRRLKELRCFRHGDREGGFPYIVTLAKDPFVPFPVGRAYLFRVEEGNSLR